MYVYFWENCIYTLVENNEQINKLFGFSFNFLPFYDKKDNLWKSGHHKNSIRFGWRYMNNDIDIFAYAYINGIRYEKFMISTKTSKWIYLSIEEQNNKYVLKSICPNGNSSIVSFEFDELKTGFLGLFIYKLFPYFGGKVSAPHNMTISLKENI